MTLGFLDIRIKNDVNIPLVIDVYLSLARRDYINVTIKWEMLSNDACPCALTPRRTRYGRLRIDEQSDEGETLVEMN